MSEMAGGGTHLTCDGTDTAADGTDIAPGRPGIAGGVGIGEAAERTGLSVYTLRFYEREGLLPGAVGRGPDGRRVYTRDDLEWLEICSRFRASGMPLATIRRYVSLVRQGTGNEAERLTLLRQHEERVTAQIGELTRCLDVISHKVKVYSEHLAEGTADGLWNPVPGNPA